MLQESFESLPTLVLQQMCYFQNSDLEISTGVSTGELCDKKISSASDVEKPMLFYSFHTFKKDRNGSWLFDLKQMF